jgi:diguanylate cyclase (GGDEF)-like protein
MHEQNNIRAERVIALLRAIFLLVVVAAVKFGAGGSRPILEVNVDVLAATGVIYVLLTAFLQQRRPASLKRTRIFLALDFAFISLIVLRTGGFQSNFVLLYLLPIVQSSVKYRFRDAAVTAAIACVIQISIASSQGLTTKVVTPLYWKAFMHVGLCAFLWFFMIQVARESRSHLLRLKELTSLVQLGSALGTSLNIDETSEAGLDVVLPLFDAQIGAISIVGTDNNITTKATKGISQANWATVRNLTKDMLDSGEREVASREVLIEDPDDPASQVSASFLIAPLIVRERTAGVLTVGKESLCPWEYPEVVLLKTVADRIATYIDIATLYNETNRLAITDDLTGAYNHRYFQERIEEEIRRADRYSRPLALVMVDVDHFKVYNDTHGHPMGDEVLKSIGSILKKWTRNVDVVSRYGGDEFTILLPETDEEGAMTVARRLKKRVEDTYFPFESSQPTGSLTISMGIASFPESAVSSKELIKNADDAMYNAKKKRNTICCSGSQLADVDLLMTQLAKNWERT